jgi:hypothetical protein
MSCSECPAAARPRADLVRMTFSTDLPGQVCTLKGGVGLEVGACYVVASSDGERVARFVGREIPVMRPCAERVVGSVLRRAAPNEVTRADELALVARDALRFCRERARELNLPRRPVTAMRTGACALASFLPTLSPTAWVTSFNASADHAQSR